jgi:hypothetical protein
MKVEILKSYNGWGKGTVAKLDNDWAKELIEKGYAVECDPGKKECKKPALDIEPEEVVVPKWPEVKEKKKPNN